MNQMYQKKYGWADLIFFLICLAAAAGVAAMIVKAVVEILQ